MSSPDGFRRKIFYLSGYDPRGARFYHQLYSEQAKLYADRSGHRIAVSERRRLEKTDFVWTIDDMTDRSSSELVFLGWDHLIREHWPRGSIRLLWGAIRSTFAFSRAADWRLIRTFPAGSLIAFYYPSLSIAALPLMLVALLWLVTGPVIASILALLISAFVVRRIGSFWLIRFLMFNDRFANDTPDPQLEARLDEMAQTIEASLNEQWDEILFITHSNGSILGISVMARLLATRGGRMPDNFALMTLGSCIPLLGCRRDAHRYRAQLERVAQGEFLWLDLGSPTDGACAPLIDPCISCTTEHRPSLHVLSPRWYKYCDPATYDRRRRNKYATHFEYLRTFDRISPLDYLRVTSSAERLPASIAAFVGER
jgi:hypothetical protein